MRDTEYYGIDNFKCLLCGFNHKKDNAMYTYIQCPVDSSSGKVFWGVCKPCNELWLAMGDEFNSVKRYPIDTWTGKATGVNNGE